LLHAYANPAHEQALRRAIAAHFPYVSVSSEINAEFREYERTCTTVLNAAVMPLAARYVDDLVARLAAKTGAIPIHLLHSAGGMIAWVDATGALKVGPRSAGAVPGPACYGLGGTEPTVSDANLILGYLNPELIYGGSIRLERARAERALEPIQRRFGLSLLDAAHAVVEVANANMQRALRLVSVQRGYDLREFTLIAYGGAGPVHAGALAREAGIAPIVV